MVWFVERRVYLVHGFLVQEGYQIPEDVAAWGSDELGAVADGELQDYSEHAVLTDRRRWELEN